MKVLVTGGAGFVGGNLCRGLASTGLKVAVLDDLSTGFRSNLDGTNVELTVGSILDVETLSRVAAGADAIVHLAARGSVPRSVNDPATTNEINVTGTLNVLQAARVEGAHVVIASSSSVYGANRAVPKHEGLVPEPMSPYAVSKLATEAYGIAFQKTYGLDTLVFRFFNIFGRLQSARHPYAAVVPCFMSALLDGDSLKIYGDGKQSRDFTSIDSVIRILTEAVDKRVVHDRPVNLAFGTSTTILDLAKCMERVTGRTAEVEWLPERAGDIRESQADNALLKSLFPGAVPDSLADGLRETMSWFLETNADQA